MAPLGSDKSQSIKIEDSSFLSTSDITLMSILFLCLDHSRKMKYLALLLMVLCLAKAFIIESEEDPKLEIEVHFSRNLLISL